MVGSWVGCGWNRICRRIVFKMIDELGQGKMAYLNIATIMVGEGRKNNVSINTI